MEIEKWQSKKFEDIKHFDEDGNEYWLARELQTVLGYTQWRNFCDPIDRAMVSCKLNEQEPKYHFADVRKMVGVGSGAEREVEDYRLTRFACYLIVMNGDPRKEPIAQGQMYFAVKTYEYIAFTDKGYMGLYGGLRADDIAEKKGIGAGQEILNYMGGAELAANLFRITQTEDVLTKNGVSDKGKAGEVHYIVGKEVRDTIGRIGGTMPEDLPMPERPISELQKEQIKSLKEP